MRSAPEMHNAGLNGRTAPRSKRASQLKSTQVGAKERAASVP